MGRWRRHARGGVIAAFHRRRYRAAFKYSCEPRRSAGGLCALSGTRHRVRRGADNERDPASVRLQTVGMCLVHIHHHAGNGRGCAIQSQPHASNPFVVHRNLLLFCLRKGVRQIENQSAGICDNRHTWTAAHVCAQRDFHAQVVGCIAHNLRSLHDTVPGAVPCAAAHDTSSSRSPHCLLAHIFQDSLLLSDAGSIRPTRLVRCDGIGSNSGCCTHSRLHRGGLSRSGSCHGNWCRKRPSSQRHWYGKRSKLLPRCRGWLGTRCG